MPVEGLTRNILKNHTLEGRFFMEANEQQFEALALDPTHQIEIAALIIDPGLAPFAHGRIEDRVTAAEQAHPGIAVELFEDHPAVEDFFNAVGSLATLPAAFPMADPEIELVAFGRGYARSLRGCGGKDAARRQKTARAQYADDGSHASPPEFPGRERINPHRAGKTRWREALEQDRIRLKKPDPQILL